MVVFLALCFVAISLILAGIRPASEICRIVIVLGWLGICLVCTTLMQLIGDGVGLGTYDALVLGFSLADTLLAIYLIAIYGVLGRQRPKGNESATPILADSP